MVRLILPAHGALAECGVTDVSACVDEAQYSLQYGIARALWGVDQLLLQLAYQLEHVRWWLVARAFTAAYDAVRAAAGPLLTPAGTLAVVLGMLLFLVAPIVGRIALINIRQALAWLVIAPLLLSQAGPWLLELEQLRGEVGGVLAGQVGALAAEGIFGAPSRDSEQPMLAPTPLYPPAGASACEAGPVSRPPQLGTEGEGVSVGPGDVAAALLLANAQDIHCPGAAPPSGDLPDAFAQAFAIDVRELRGMAPDARALALRRLQTGSTRLALGSVACALADMAELIQICFALALVALWLGLPIAAVLVLFAPDLRPVGAILRRAVSVVVTSWLVSLLMGLLTACLAAAASTGSATAALALAVGGVLLAGRLLLVAASTLTESLTGLGGILGAAAGGAALSVGAGVGSLAARAVSTGGSLAGGAADAAGSLAGGAAATIATATIAAGRSGDWRSGAAVAIGRIRPVAQVGAVAAAMGAAPPALADALEEGQRVARAGVVAYAREARAARASAGTGVDAAHGRAEGQVRAGVQRARAAAARGDAEQPAEVVGEPKVVTI